MFSFLNLNLLSADSPQEASGASFDSAVAEFDQLNSFRPRLLPLGDTAGGETAAAGGETAAAGETATGPVLSEVFWGDDEVVFSAISCGDAGGEGLGVSTEGTSGPSLSTASTLRLLDSGGAAAEGAEVWEVCGSEAAVEELKNLLHVAAPSS